MPQNERVDSQAQTPMSYYGAIQVPTLKDENSVTFRFFPGCLVQKGGDGAGQAPNFGRHQFHPVLFDPL
jgi:hypothetical protein